MNIIVQVANKGIPTYIPANANRYFHIGTPQTGFQSQKLNFIQELKTQIINDIQVINIKGVLILSIRAITQIVKRETPVITPLVSNRHLHICNIKTESLFLSIKSKLQQPHSHTIKPNNTVNDKNTTTLNTVSPP